MTTKEIIKAEQGEKALTGFADNKGLEFLQEAMAHGVCRYGVSVGQAEVSLSGSHGL